MLDPLPRQYREALDTIRRAKRVFVIAHRDPDGDAVGSTLAVGHLLEALGKEYHVAAASPAPPQFAYLPRYAELRAPEHFTDHDLLLLLDVGDVERSNLAERIAERKPELTVLNVDHHTTRREYNGADLVDLHVQDRRASSTCEMVYRLFEHAEVIPSRDAATCMLTGIVTDTGMLQNAGTSAAAIAILGELMNRGANLQQVLRATFRNKSVGALKIWGRALSRLRVDPTSGFVSTVLTQKDFDECGVTDDSAEGIANFLLSLHDAPASVVVQDKGNGIVKASLRSIDPTVNVADIAKQYGGGGHPRAAGFAVTGRVVETESGYAVVPA